MIRRIIEIGKKAEERVKKKKIYCTSMTTRKMRCCSVFKHHNHLHDRSIMYSSSYPFCTPLRSNLLFDFAFFFFRLNTIRLTFFLLLVRRK